MKYTYAYKTSDGKRHEAAMEAASREAVFETLRARGIKAIKVVAEDGSKANGEISGSPRQGGGHAGRVTLPGGALGITRPTKATALAAAAVCVLLIILAAIAWRLAGDGAAHHAAIAGRPPYQGEWPTRSPRHQIYGDPAVMEAFERGDFGEALPREGDRMLAMFAQPGRYMCARGVNPRLAAPCGPLGERALPGWRSRGTRDPTGAAVAGRPPYQDGGHAGRVTLPGRPSLTGFEEYARDELAEEKDIGIAPGDSREVRELKQIVNGMREEMREYLANGNGTPRSYWRRLNERTEEEAQIYERTMRELEGEKDPEAWEEKNAALRRIGLRTIPRPNE